MPELSTNTSPTTPPIVLNGAIGTGGTSEAKSDGKKPVVSGDGVDATVQAPSNRSRLSKMLGGLGRVIKKAAILGAVVGALIGGFMIYKQVTHAPKPPPTQIEVPHTADPSHMPNGPPTSTMPHETTLPTPAPTTSPTINDGTNVTPRDLRNGRPHEIRTVQPTRQPVRRP